MGSVTVNATRMRTTRRMLGMSRENLSAITEGRVSVGAVAKLERGDPIEDDGTALYSLAAALQVPSEFLLSQPSNDAYRETPSWRAVKKIPQYVADGLYERLVYFADKYRDLEEYVEREQVKRSDLSPSIMQLRDQHEEGAPLGSDAIERYAELMREHICISRESSFECLERIAETMESFGIKVASWSLPTGISGLSLVFGKENGQDIPLGAAVLINHSHPVERRRFSLAHEWGHLVLPSAGNWQADETACNRFAGALLMPRDNLAEEVKSVLGSNIGEIGDAFRPELLNLKIRYGVSTAALMRRCYDIGLVPSSERYTMICRRMGQRGWFRTEPEPRWQNAEEARGFVNLVKRLDEEDRQRGVDQEFLDDVQFLDAAQ